ncbi:hypothetical protein HanXRQr2_Chr09g0412401 [Helianthus annuus]|uniref:Uncharacterized protein n=1 Tax=Helianthus annuus TaxID=4232 RepID=A0A9K3I9X0_HELAN|nr:hypothetical protein HanXRQr2_Chr09g0412401 [Helianthus annuus]
MYVVLAITIIFFSNNFVSMKLVYSIGSRWQHIGESIPLLLSDLVFYSNYIQTLILPS